YYEAVSTYLHAAIDEYKMEQEYQMFVNMLREYLQRKSAKQEIVHVLMNKPILFYDDSLEAMTKEKLAEMMDRRLLSNHPVYVDSDLIAPLLSMAPHKIFLYTEDEDQLLIRTLRNIFEERLAVFSPDYFYTLQT